MLHKQVLRCIFAFCLLLVVCWLSVELVLRFGQLLLITMPGTVHEASGIQQAPFLFSGAQGCSSSMATAPHAAVL